MSPFLTSILNPMLEVRLLLYFAQATVMLIFLHINVSPALSVRSGAEI